MRLEVIVFISGAVVMAYELAAARLLAPHLGSSLHTWTSIIGVILLSLSLGYWWGGRRADANPSANELRKLLFRAAACVVVTAIFQELVLTLLRRAPFDIRVTSVIATLILFAPASIILGMVSPYAARLRLENLSSSGATVGTLYAVSTVGSIVGTFVTGFYLLAWFGSSQILALLAGCLLFCGLLLMPLSSLSAFAIACISSLGLYVGLDRYTQIMSGGRIDIDTVYNRIWIVEEEQDGRRLRHLHTHAFTSQSVVNLDNPDELVLPYARLMAAAAQAVSRPQRALVIGGAGCSLPRALRARYPEMQVDVVEIDPAMTEVAQKYFFLQADAQMGFYHEDGRTFINREHAPYDLIYVDAYDANLTLPFQLATLEAIRRYHALLSEEGVWAMNTIAASAGLGSELLNSIWKTIDAVFPSTVALASRPPVSAEEILNVVLVASKSPAPLEAVMEAVGTEHPALQRVGHKALPVLTDEYAPVEHYALRGLPEWIRRRRGSQAQPSES
ncbi:MAG: fused MFS/spermidine synthase [Bdellovibrionota bacterium]|nr:MAG: fused MFS/spermidine synthase [Bdellovibrionota bacterium]